MHLTETCDEELPHLITHVETTPATTPDFHLATTIHQALADKELLPREHLLDAGYVDAEMMVQSQEEHGIKVVGPVPPDNHWQARAGQGFDVACFVMDWEARRATCPQGHQSSKWSQTHDKHRNEIINIRFARSDCLACPARKQCTTKREGPREITVRPQAQHLALQAGRQRQRTPEFKAQYDRRAGVEGTLGQGLRMSGLRRARYIGLAKTHLQHVLTAAALNVRRIGAWLGEVPQAKTRTAPFVALLQSSS